MQADEHDDGGWVGGEVGRAVAAAEQGDELAVDDFDELLARGQALEDILAESLLFDPLNKVLGDLEVDVGFE